MCALLDALLRTVCSAPTLLVGNSNAQRFVCQTGFHLAQQMLSLFLSAFCSFIWFALEKIRTFDALFFCQFCSRRRKISLQQELFEHGDSGNLLPWLAFFIGVCRGKVLHEERVVIKLTISANCKKFHSGRVYATGLFSAFLYERKE